MNRIRASLASQFGATNAQWLHQADSQLSWNTDSNEKREHERTPTPKTRKVQNTLLSEGLDPNSSPFIAPPSAQPQREFIIGHDSDDDESIDLEEFDLEGFTEDEIRAYNTIAEPGQRLQDALIPSKMESHKQDLSKQGQIGTTSTMPSTSKSPSVLKQVALFARRHAFMAKVMQRFTKSERRQFERDVYDFAEALGLDHTAAKRQVIKARGYCGEEDYESENSVLGDKVDDSADILKRLAIPSGTEPVVLPSIEHPAIAHAKPQAEAKVSPKKSPYFSASKLDASKRKRKVSEQGPTETALHHKLKRPRGKQHESCSTTDVVVTKPPIFTVDPNNTAMDLSGGVADAIDHSNTGVNASLHERPSNDRADTIIEQRDSTIDSRASSSHQPKAARRAAKRARRVERADIRKDRDREAKESQNHKASDYQTMPDIKVTEDVLRANQKALHERGQTFDNTLEKKTEIATQAAADVENLRGKIQSTSNEYIKLNEGGNVVHETKEPNESLVDMKERQDDGKNLKATIRKPRGKKRKSASDRPDSHQQSSSSIQEVTKYKEAEKVVESRKATETTPGESTGEGFLRPMIYIIASTRPLESPACGNTLPPYKAYGELDDPNEGDHERTSHLTRNPKRSKSVVPSTRKLRSHTVKPPTPDDPLPPHEDHLKPPPSAASRKKRSKSADPASLLNSKCPKRSIKVSPYFKKLTLRKTTAASKVSCIPFPPLSSTSFGLVQERLSHDPFRLLIAVIFLNKTRGSVALPVFYELMDRYPAVADLAAADHEDVVEIIQHLGLQNQRAHKCIKLAQAWLERPPEKGKRYRFLHYPNRGDGKDIKRDEILNEEDPRVAWEVGQLPGIGAYAIDSWRIFCRDKMRGLPHGLPQTISPETKETELQKEWTKVLPLDKELRAYLRWRWLRNGWEWDPLTGEKREAGEEAMEKAERGGVICEGEGGDGGVVVADEEGLGLRKVEMEGGCEG